MLETCLLFLPLLFSCNSQRMYVTKSVIIQSLTPRIMAHMDSCELASCIAQTKQLLTGVRQGCCTLCPECYFCCLQMYYRIHVPGMV